MSQGLTPSPLAVPADHPRLGGWAELAADTVALAKLPAASAWAARNLDMLSQLEQAGRRARRGGTPVHFARLPPTPMATAPRAGAGPWAHHRLSAPSLRLPHA